MSVDDLVRMANQIAANQRHLPSDEAAKVVATHIKSFWAPSMQRDLAEAVRDGRAELSEAALLAIRQLQPV